MLALVVFVLDSQRYALDLSAVTRVVHAAAIARLPKAPPIVLGIIDLQGQIVPVLDIRTRFGLPNNDLRLSDKFIIAHTRARTVAIVADSVAGLADCPDDAIVKPAEVAPGASLLEGIAALPDGITLIHDLDTFLSLDELRALDRALAAERPGE